MISVEIKINKKKIYHIKALRYPGTSTKGTNAYKCNYQDVNGEKKDFLVAHKYEDGVLILINRMIDKIK